MPEIEPKAQPYRVPATANPPHHGARGKFAAALRLKKVIERVGLSRSTVYAKIAKQEFPAPIHLSLRAVGWLEVDIDDWLATRRASAARKGDKNA